MRISPVSSMSIWAPVSSVMRLMTLPPGPMTSRILSGLICTIEIADDGTISIASVSSEGGEAAKRKIQEIVAEVEVGKVYNGTVLRLLDFGAIVSLLPGKDGLLHISQISHQRVNNVSDHLKEGQQVKVKVLESDEKGRVRLSMKAISEQQPAAAESSG